MTASVNPVEVADILRYLTPSERDALHSEVVRDRAIWRPLPGPQSIAYESAADVIGYGGAAGGGKTDLAIGKALTQHRRVAFFRVNGTELTAVLDRIEEMIGTREGLGGRPPIWRIRTRWPARSPIVQIEFGSTPNPGDERKYRGRPKDLLVLDEAAEFIESQPRFLMGWVRSTDLTQRCQTLMTFNPPTRAECRWIIEYFAPWLDPSHPLPAVPGELRWFARLPGADRDIEVPSGESFTHNGEIVRPHSRTFIPARLADNPYLARTGYMATLQSLPEPLRSQMLYGDFSAGVEDDAMQVIPRAWVKAAMSRWRRLEPLPEMDSVGVDVARSGKDRTTIARRHGAWFDEPIVYPGTATPNGQTVAGLVLSWQRDRAPIHIDVIGVGASPYDMLVERNAQVLGVNVAEKSHGTDASGMLTFANIRSELWWRMREALDPASNRAIALPPDGQLLEELCMPRWYLRGKSIYVESREDLLKPERLGRSPDMATAYLLALMDTPKGERVVNSHGIRVRRAEADYDPFDPRGI